MATKPIRLFTVTIPQGNVVIRVPEDFVWNAAYSTELAHIQRSLNRCNYHQAQHRHYLQHQLQRYVFLREEPNVLLAPYQQRATLPPATFFYSERNN